MVIVITSSRPTLIKRGSPWNGVFLQIALAVVDLYSHRKGRALVVNDNLRLKRAFDKYQSIYLFHSFSAPHLQTTSSVSHYFHWPTVVDSLESRGLTKFFF